MSHVPLYGRASTFQNLNAMGQARKMGVLSRREGLADTPVDVGVDGRTYRELFAADTHLQYLALELFGAIGPPESPTTGEDIGPVQFVPCPISPEAFPFFAHPPAPR